MLSACICISYSICYCRTIKLTGLLIVLVYILHVQVFHSVSAVLINSLSFFIYIYIYIYIPECL